MAWPSLCCNANDIDTRANIDHNAHNAGEYKIRPYDGNDGDDANDIIDNIVHNASNDSDDDIDTIYADDNDNVGANLVFAHDHDDGTMATMTALYRSHVRHPITEPTPMPYNPDTDHRRSIRLPDYDYSQADAYFVTICAAVRQPWFGNVAGAEMWLNVAGQMISAEWQNLPTRFPRIALDIFIVMPDHLHGIVHSIDGPTPASSRDDGRPHGTAPGSLGRIVQAFKSLTTHAYIQGVNKHGWPPFFGKLWQRNYYERIIRGEAELQRTYEYIVRNPLRWDSAV